MSATSRLVDAQGLSLHVRETSPQGAPTVLFLHGWLDHCHSFDWLIDALPPSLHTLALDFRGHGESGHAPPGASYQFPDYLADVELALAGLAVEEVHLVGHSLGGSVALMYAAARPGRIRSLTTIESLGPTGGAPEQAVERLRIFLLQLQRPSRRRLYASVEDAAARLRENNSGLSAASALHLARFGTRPVEGGVEFRFDPAHRKLFGLKLDEEQVLSLLGAVDCPVQVLHGTSGFTLDDAQMRARLARLRSPTPIALPGGHHVHLDSPAAAAEHVARFIALHSPGG